MKAEIAEKDRKDPHLHSTGTPGLYRGFIPLLKKAHSRHWALIFPDEVWRTRFNYRQDTVFNATTYLGFLEQLARRYCRQGLAAT